MEELPSGLLAAAATTVVAAVLSLYFRARPKPVYLVDFVCYKPPDSLRTPAGHFIEHADSILSTEEGKEFNEKLTRRSGISGEACMPPGVHEIPPNETRATSTVEIEEVLFTVVSELIEKTGTDPKTIDILVTNCSIFCATPSISSMVATRFGFREDVKSFSLSGMGCSAGLSALSLAKDLLGVHPNSRALVLSMESVTANGYKGGLKSMLIANVLFRMGGAGILLSNRGCNAATAKYELQHLVRTHVGADDKAYRSVFQDVDEDGRIGVSISRSLLSVAGKALKINLSELGPLVLPYSEQLRYASSLAWRHILRPISPKPTEDSLYVPNFKKSFEHFCIHAGGRAVVDGLAERLKLTREDSEASRMTLYRFGNTSSSSVWYELSYLEAKGRVKMGDRVWQLGLGSGFKCNSAVWKRIKLQDSSKEINAWSDRIHAYPVQVIDADY